DDSPGRRVGRYEGHSTTSASPTAPERSFEAGQRKGMEGGGVALGMARGGETAAAMEVEGEPRVDGLGEHRVYHCRPLQRGDDCALQALRGQRLRRYCSVANCNPIRLREVHGNPSGCVHYERRRANL